MVAAQQIDWHAGVSGSRRPACQSQQIPRQNDGALDHCGGSEAGAVWCRSGRLLRPEWGDLLADVCTLGGRDGDTHQWLQEFQPSDWKNIYIFLFWDKKDFRKKKQDIEGGKWEFGFGDFRVSFRHLTGDLNKPLDLWVWSFHNLMFGLHPWLSKKIMSFFYKAMYVYKHVFGGRVSQNAIYNYLFNNF